MVKSHVNLLHQEHMSRCAPDYTNGYEQLIHFLTQLNRVNGTLYPPFVETAHLEKLKTFKLRLDDVFLVCYPKSGTHWLMKIVNLIMHNGGDTYVNSTPSREEIIWIEESGKPGTYMYIHTQYIKGYS